MSRRNKLSFVMAAVSMAAFSLPSVAAQQDFVIFHMSKDVNSYINTITITDDRGGLLLDYAARVQRAHTYGERIRFDGFCGSACTLYLNVPGCVTENASFGFHLPTGGKPAKDWLMAQYPQWVKDFLRDNGGLQVKPTIMPFDYAVQHIPRCY